MEANLLCPLCKSLMSHTPQGLVCRNPKCSSRKHQIGEFVKDRRRPQLGVGRIVGIGGHKQQVAITGNTYPHREYLKSIGLQWVPDKRIWHGMIATEHILSIQNDLGLGVQVVGHDVYYRIKFKSGEEEVYVEFVDKYILPPGTMVKTSFGHGMVASSSMPSGELYYQMFFPTGTKTIREDVIDDILPADAAQKLKNHNIDTPSKFALRTMAKFFKIAQYSEELTCIWNSRVELMPHQVGVAHRAIQEYSPRLILADEVGLGKTMEAGFILKELKARGLVNRVLIVTPASLVTQWQHEMLSKFNERFEILDTQSVSVYQASNPNLDVYSIFENVLCSVQWAKKRMDDFGNQFWDLIIFDEAHHLRRKMVGKKIEYTKNYHFASALKDRCNAMLLLTATPMQLDPYEFYSLIELLDPTMFQYYELFSWYNDDYMPTLKHVLSELKSKGNAFKNDKNLIGKLDDVISVGTKLFLQGKFDPESIVEDLLKSEEGRLKLENLLQKFILLPKIMIRNRKREVFKHLQKRIVSTIGIDYTEEEVQLYKEISEFVKYEYNRALRENQAALGFVMVIFQKMLTSSRYALLKSFRKRIEALRTKITSAIEFNETEFEELDENEQQKVLEKLLLVEPRKGELQTIENLCKKIEAIKYDSKLDAAVKAIDTFFEKDPNEKVLIFTQFIGTQEYLKMALQERYNVVMFNGQMSKEEKDKNTIKFKEAAQIMISTEAGGEGRNFQFSHIMINYDLPWNPMKVEQRIGRLDRIGQKKNVFVYNLATINTVEQRILEVLYARIEKFRQIIGEIEPILGDLEKDVKKIIMSQGKDLEEEFNRLEKSIDEKLEEAKVIQRKLEDFLMDTRQYNFETVEQILGKTPIISSDRLKGFVKAAVLGLGGTAKFEDSGNNIYKIHLPMNFKRNKCRYTEYVGTFDQNLAREEEKLEFFAFGHELIEDLLWYYAGTEFEPVCTVIEVPSNVSTGYLFLYTIEIEGLSITNKFLPVFISETGEYNQDKSNDVFQIIENNFYNAAVLTPTISEDIDKFKTDAESIVTGVLDAELEKTQKKHSKLLSKELIRWEQLFQLRRSKLDDELKKEKDQFQKIKNSGDEKQKRILPALDGKIKKLEERIDNLEEEKHDKVSNLKEKDKVNSNYSLIGIAKIIIHSSNNQSRDN